MSGAPDEATAKAMDEIAALIETFKQASQKGDVPKLRSVFHASARLVGTAYENGAPSSYNKVRDEFVFDYAEQPLGLDGNGQPLPQGKGYSARLESLQLHGPDTAVAVLREDHCWGDTSFIDILSLWKEQGKGWQIVNKTFTQFPTPA